MNAGRRWTVGIAAGLIVLAAAIVLTTVSSRWTPQAKRLPPVAPPPTLFPAPDFRLRSFGGPLIALSDFRGGTVVLNFWASWCLPCREEMPNLERAWREFRGRGVTVVGLNVADDYDEGAAFLVQFKITYPNAYDPEQTRLNAYRVSGLPTTIFIDAEMRARARVSGGYLGSHGYEQLRRQILAILRS